MKNNKHDIISIAIYVILAITTSLSLCNFVQIKKCINNFNEKRMQDIASKYSVNKNIQSYGVNGSLYLDAQKELDADYEIFIHRLLDVKKGLFDSNTITFLVTLIVVLLAGYLLSTQEKIRKLSDKCQNDLNKNGRYIQTIKEKSERINELEVKANIILNNIACQEKISEKYRKDFDKQVVTISRLINQYSLLHKVEVLYSTALRLQPVLESQKHTIKSIDNNILLRIDKYASDLINDIMDAKYRYVSKEAKVELIETLENTIFIFKMEQEAREREKLKPSRILNCISMNLDNLLNHVKEIRDI